MKLENTKLLTEVPLRHRVDIQAGIAECVACEPASQPCPTYHRDVRGVTDVGSCNFFHNEELPTLSITASCDQSCYCYG